jgi:hypothetical protein
MHAILIKQVRFRKEGSTRGKPEEQTKEGPWHVSWTKSISESNRSIGGTALLDPGVRDGERRQHRTK